MIRCPKCNFEQPNDEFCAQCGVHMSRYKKHLPLKERLSKNSLTYLVLLLFCVIGTIFFIKNHWFSSPEDLTASLQPSTSPISTAKISRTMASDTKQNPTNSNAKDDNKNINLANPYVVVRILAIPTSVLSFFEARVLSHSELNQTTVLHVPPSKDTYLEQLDQMEHFYKTKYYANVFQKPLIIQQTVFSERLEDELGFIFNISIDSYKQNDLRVRLNISSNFLLQANAEEPTWQKLDETLTFKKNDTYIIYGILPQREISEEEALLFNSGYLALLKERSYQLEEVTFALIFTYKY